jgi:hypothetical protein
MISIISGPTCVGKTYFIENKKDRILELSNLPPTTESYVTGSFSSNHSEFPDVVSHWIKRNDGGAIFDQIVCIHHNRLTDPEAVKELINTYKDNYWYFSKTVIILGVPYSEYKDRIFQRHDNFRNFKPSDIILDSNIEILDLYKEWIDELNKDKIPYVLVEAIGDYKVLEEEEFFRMLK